MKKDHTFHKEIVLLENCHMYMLISYKDTIPNMNKFRQKLKD